MSIIGRKPLRSTGYEVKLETLCYHFLNPYFYMRNIFDQYEQPENKLTHALACTLANEPRIIRPFLKWLRVDKIPHLKDIQTAIQQSPGKQAIEEKKGQSGLPDMCFFDEDGWAVLVECKVQSRVSTSQLLRHRKTAARYGYEEPFLVVIGVELPSRALPKRTRYVQWKDLYSWFAQRAEDSNWTKHFVDYMQVFEAKMLSQDYDIRGTLTMFDGFKFNDKNPYTYSEGKRLIKLLGEEFRKDKRLVRELGLDPQGKGRGAITRGQYGGVWDFIPLRIAKKAKLFTEHPHATMGIHPRWTNVAITVPNGVKGGIKGHLKAIGQDGFYDLLSNIEQRLRKVLRGAPGSQPMFYLVQRHYRSQRSSPVEDGRLDVDLRTAVKTNATVLKYQPMWFESIYQILTNKKTNIQWGINVHFPYGIKVMQSRKALRILSEAWTAMKPLMDFATEKVNYSVPTG